MNVTEHKIIDATPATWNGIKVSIASLSDPWQEPAYPVVAWATVSSESDPETNERFTYIIPMVTRDDTSEPVLASSLARELFGSEGFWSMPSYPQAVIRPGLAGLWDQVVLGLYLLRTDMTDFWANLHYFRGNLEGAKLANGDTPRS